MSLKRRLANLKKQVSHRDPSGMTEATRRLIHAILANDRTREVWMDLGDAVCLEDHQEADRLTILLDKLIGEDPQLKKMALQASGQVCP